MNIHRRIVRSAGIHLRQKMRHLMREAVASASVMLDRAGTPFETSVDRLCVALKVQINGECDRIKRHRSNYEPLFSLPPCRRQPSPPRLPLTLVERRATAARGKVIEWQRKAKLAATKIKSYRKKVSYYKKKGVIS